VEDKKLRVSKVSHEEKSLGDVVEEIFLGLSLARQAKGVVQTASRATVTVKDLSDGFLPPISDLQKADMPTTSQIERFSLREGDVVISARGSIKVAGVQKEHAGALAGANLIVVRPGRALKPPLVLAFLRHPLTISKLEALTAGTTVSSLNLSTVSRLRLNVPPIHKQGQIADLVQLADQHYAAARRAAEVRLQLAQEVAIGALTI
jgi:restriction endonuclease S subunit